MAFGAAQVMFILSSLLLAATVTASLSFADSIDLFSGKFLKEASIQPKNKGKNVVVSALSADIVMEMVAYGASGETQKQLLNALDISDLKTIKPQITKTIDDLNNTTDVTLRLANKAYFNKNLNGKMQSIAPSYKELIKCVFLSQVDSLNFAQNVKSAATMNKWVADETNNLINNLISPDSLSGDTSGVLINAIYFKGNWTNKFDHKLTKKEKFTLADGSKVLVNMMNQQNKFQYSDVPELDARMIVLPYNGGETSMVIILPNSYNGINALEDKLAVNGLKKYMNNLYEAKVNLKLPSFKISSDIDVKECFQNLGVKLVFTPSADLSKILADKEKGLYISTAIQKAMIEVNEDGAEAAAATAVGIVGLSLPLEPPEIINYNVNQPCVFAIMKNDIILFSGAFKGK